MRRLMLHNEQGGILPSGYTQVKYLRSNGKQYIDTQTKYIGNIGILLEFAFKSSYLNDKGFLGNVSPSNVFAWTNGSNIVLMNEGRILNLCSYDNNIHLLKFNFLGDKSITLDDNALSFAIKYFTNQKTFYVFSAHFNSDYGKIIGDIYQLTITENDEIKNQFITCLDSNNVPCMYDTITKTTFYNNGTGSFGYETLDGTYVAPV